MPSAAAPAAMYSCAIDGLTPPVGSILTCGNGPLRARRYLAPPTAEQGKIFTMSAPAFQAVMTSVGVSAPGKTAMSLAVRCGDGRQIEAGADDELRPGVDACPRIVGGQHRARADHRAITESIDELRDDADSRPEPSS